MAAKVTEAKATEGKATEAKTTVTIHLPRAPRGEQNFQFVGVHGKAYKIMRGVDVEVPPEVAEVLECSRKAREEADAYLDATAH